MGRNAGWFWLVFGSCSAGCNGGNTDLDLRSSEVEMAFDPSSLVLALDEAGSTTLRVEVDGSTDALNNANSFFDVVCPIPADAPFEARREGMEGFVAPGGVLQWPLSAVGRQGTVYPFEVHCLAIGEAVLPCDVIQADDTTAPTGADAEPIASTTLSVVCDASTVPPLEICDNGTDDDADLAVDCDDADCAATCPLDDRCTLGDVASLGVAGLSFVAAEIGNNCQGTDNQQVTAAGPVDFVCSAGGLLPNDSLSAAGVACDEPDVFCTADGPDTPFVTSFVVYVAVLDAALPISAPDQAYQYGLFLASDDDPYNDYLPPSELSGDPAGGADMWVLFSTSEAGWGVEVYDVASNEGVARESSAVRVVARDDTLMVVIPTNEIASTSAPWRMSAFAWDGEGDPLDPGYIMDVTPPQSQPARTP